jgi:tRNA A37 threonylcarbamoyladenosine dehydratase
MQFDRERRFGGMGRLHGPDGAERLRMANVCVVGIGGVGSWTVEALARSGVEHITAIDLDMVAESNTNRQIHALGDIYGKAKVEAMGERVRAINPGCKFTAIDDFITPENTESLLGKGFSVVVDAIDQVRAKVAMIAFCHARRIPIVVTGAAGGQSDPTRVNVTDLSQTIQDPLLSKVRSMLRRDHGFPRGDKKFGVSAVFSTEPLRYPEKSSECSVDRSPTGLNCSGFGSSVCVTSVFGMVAAAQAMDIVLRKQKWA